MNSTWRDIAAPIIAEVIAEFGIENPKTVRKQLLGRYPFGEREYWPYKIWCDEINRQLATGKHKTKPADEPLFALLQEQEHV